MAAAQDAEISLSNTSCRILVLSPKIYQAKSCIDRIQNPTQSLPLSPKPLSTTGLLSSPGLIKIPWTITNKYYSATVHFAVHRMHGLSPHQVQNIPAIIFVWSQGESYKHHIKRLAQDLSGLDPEVCLAVRLSHQTSSRPTSPASEEEEEEKEDESDIDGFLSSHGFEYIDATEKNAAEASEDGDEDAWSTEIPGIERVLDALSTIMWPSMQPTTKDTAPSRQTREQKHVLLDWANTFQDNSLPAVEEVVASSSSQLSDRTRAMKREMQELARWLEEDETMRDDPWKTAASSGRMSASPTAMEFCDQPFRQATESSTFGFDDDFTVFVSAPALDDTETSGRSTPDQPTDIDGLSPPSAIPHAGSLYRSLGSVSDFGGSEDGRDADDDGVEGDLPTKVEILATSSRIFGSSKFPLPPTIETRTDTMKANKPAQAEEINTSKILADEDLEAFTIENPGAAGGGDGSYGMEPFDLSKVLGTLREMKAEIANMTDEDERRKAAARVALGLVYGLEADR